VSDAIAIAELEARLRARPLPRHVAIIMDGNGRWAEARGLPRVTARTDSEPSRWPATRACRRIGVQALTLYAFSTENWARPDDEVEALMHLLAEFLESERPEMMQNGIRLNAIGELSRLPGFVQAKLAEVREETAGNRGMTLTLALSYGGRQEIIEAARAAAAHGAIDTAGIEAALWTRGLPDLDLLIRTSGERRISNFLLWQCAYAELHFTEVLWPDFRDAELFGAIADFQARERRFGRTGAQLAGRGE